MRGTESRSRAENKRELCSSPSRAFPPPRLRPNAPASSCDKAIASVTARGTTPSPIYSLKAMDLAVCFALLPARLARRQRASPLPNGAILSRAAGPRSTLSFLLCGLCSSDANSLPNILPPRPVACFQFSSPSFHAVRFSVRLAPASPVVHIVLLRSRA